MGTQVDLIWKDDGTDLKALRKMLHQTLVAAGCQPYWQEWRAGSTNLPQHLKQYDRQVILVNGYVALTDFNHTNAAYKLKQSVHAYKKRVHRNSLSINAVSFANVLIPLVVLLFPKCAVCWAAYFTLLSAIGINVPYLPELRAGFMILGIVFCIYLFFKAETRRQNIPPALMLLSLLISILNYKLLNGQIFIALLCMFLSFYAALLIVQKGRGSVLLPGS